MIGPHVQENIYSLRTMLKCVGMYFIHKMVEKLHWGLLLLGFLWGLTRTSVLFGRWNIVCHIGFWFGLAEKFASHCCYLSWGMCALQRLRSVWRIALGKMSFLDPKVLIFFLFLHKNIGYGYSLEAPHRGTSNEYPQHIFSWRNKKIIYLIPLLSRPMWSESLQSPLWVDKYPKHLQASSVDWTVCVDVQADLSPPWLHMQSGKKCCALAHLFLSIEVAVRKPIHSVW